MNSTGFVIVAYIAGLGLLWGYAALMWLESRRVRVKVEAKNGSRS